MIVPPKKMKLTSGGSFFQLPDRSNTMKNHEKAVEMCKAAHPYDTKTMYHVEKFMPTECPKCRHPFKNGNVDWHRLLGDVIDGKKVFRELNGYYIIVCAQCSNYTAQFPIESYQLSDKAQAQKLCDEAGFVNLTEVLASGTHCRDIHAIFCKPPGIKTESLMIAPEEVVDAVDLEADNAEIHPISDIE
jgi:hypothetical protein